LARPCQLARLQAEIYITATTIQVHGIPAIRTPIGQDLESWKV
jgi:hypothetical protein